MSYTIISGIKDFHFSCTHTHTHTQNTPHARNTHKTHTNAHTQHTHKTRTHTHTQTHTNTHTHNTPHTNTHTPHTHNTHTNTHTNTHPQHTHTQTHAHNTHTHAHTHNTQICTYPGIWFHFLQLSTNFIYRSFATRVSQLKIWHFRVIGIERNICRCTFNRYSVVTQFAKLAAGEQLCRRCTHRKL